MEDAIEALADHVIETKLEDIPSSAIRAAKTYILDTIGVGLAGSIGPYVEELVSTFGNSVIDPENSARVIGQNIRLSPGKAALLNGFQIHNSEFDCVHEEAVVHTMTVLLATLLADADKRGGVTGETLMRASVLGVDVACNLGVAASSALQFFRPATAGAFAAVAAVACAREFDKDRLLRAFSLVYIQLSGTMQAHTEGSSLLALQIGLNAQNALAACDLADNGLPGLKGILEGRFGYFGLIEAAGDIHSVLPTLKQNWRINEVAHKPFPSGRATHGIVDAIRELQMHNEIDANEVVRLETRVPSLINHLVGRPVHDKMEISYARLNGQYAAAVMLQNKFIGIHDYTNEAIRNKSSIELAKKVEIIVNDNPDPNALSPIEIDIFMQNGQKLSKRIETVYGNPRKPLSREEHLTKFRRNWQVAKVGLIKEESEKLIALVDNLESVADIKDLIDLVTG